MTEIKNFFMKEWVAWTVFAICAVASICIWRARAPKVKADTAVEQAIQNKTDRYADLYDEDFIDEYSEAVGEISSNLSSMSHGLIKTVFRIVRWAVSLVGRVVVWFTSLGVVGMIVVIVIIIKIVGKKRK